MFSNHPSFIDFLSDIVYYLPEYTMNYSLLVTDMIVLVGDLVDSSVENLKEAVQPLSKLSAPKGKFFVTGTFNQLVLSIF